MTFATLLALSALAADPSPAPPPATPEAPTAAPPAAQPAPPATPAATPSAKPAKKPRPTRPAALQPASLPSVEGEVLEIDHRAHRFRLRATSEEVVLTFDRNTLVTGPAGATTPLQISPGARVKAGRDGATRAAWVELKAPPSSPKATP